MRALFGSTESVGWASQAQPSLRDWTFDAATGVLLSKQHADGESVEYDYEPDGRLKTRTWARGSLTTYEYHASTAELKKIDYSDTSTPDVELTYNRLGLLKTVTDGTGVRTFAYNADLELIKEDLPAFFGSSRDLIREYSPAVVGRLSRLGTDTNGDGVIDTEYDSALHYDDATARTSRVTGPGLPVYGAAYSYLTNSNLVERTEFRPDAGTTIARTTRGFESSRDLVTSLENRWVAENPERLVSRYAYRSDAAARRSDVVRTGEAFAIGHLDFWQYNPRNELTRSDRFNSTDPQNPTNPVDALDFVYGYDSIGNRQQYDYTPDGASQVTTLHYDANDLNQYDAVLLQAGQGMGQRLFYDVDGNLTSTKLTADMNCDGSVNGYDIVPFQVAISDNCVTYNAQYPNCDCLNGDLNGDGSVNGFDIDPFTTALTGAGGEPSVAMSKYVWDGENRLIRVEPLAGAGPNSTKLEFGYDYLSRRVERRDYAYTDGQWVLGEHHRFVYDGWNVIEELDATQGGGQPPVIRKYTWGLDLAGQNGAPSASGMTPQGAGGIGGLLACYDTGGGTTSTSDDRTFLYFFDANGNVGQLIETTGGPGGVNPQTPLLASYGALAAKYEYDPYGGRLNTPGAGEYAQAYQFSTKRLDPDTGLLYYGHRDLNTSLGRWTNRDPFSEAGAVLARHRRLGTSDERSRPTLAEPDRNLYVFVANRPTGAVDALGLNLYAIDGTWSGMPWNHWGTNTRWIFQLTLEPKHYWHGPASGVTGDDARPIADQCMDQICNDLRQAYQRCESQPTVNLVGWSRGAAIATWVAHRLDRDGCCMSRYWWGWCKTRVYPNVNWLGLFDAVDMAPAIPNWAMTAPPNVRVISHAVKTTTDARELLMFPTAPILPQTLFWRKSGAPTTHSDIGADMFNNDAFFWMRTQARGAGVNIR